MSMLFKKIGLVARRNSPHIGEPLNRLATLLRQHDCTGIILDADTAAEHPIAEAQVVPPGFRWSASIRAGSVL
jgi:NAD+ kinase